MAVQLVPVNPYDQTGFLLPFVVRRMIDMGRQHMTEMAPDTWAKIMTTKLAVNDPNALLIAAVGERGDVVGHMACSVETDGTERWVFISQCRIDPGEGSSDPTLVKRGLELVDAWAQARGVKRMVMATPRSDEAWRRKYNFKTLRHLMSREVGSPVGREEAS